MGNMIVVLLIKELYLILVPHLIYKGDEDGTAGLPNCCCSGKSGNTHSGILGKCGPESSKYFRFNAVQHHQMGMKELSFAPSGAKFCTCADESSAKVIDLRTQKEERQLVGHGWDIRSIEWHPEKGTLVEIRKD
jgi:hypothetical protein